MSKTFREVCNYLTNKCGHKDLWLDWLPWQPGISPQYFPKQPCIISCSGRLLAEYDGKVWYFLNNDDYLQFNSIDDVNNHLITMRDPINEDAIEYLPGIWMF